jgi:cytochrome c556
MAWSRRLDKQWQKVDAYRKKAAELRAAAATLSGPAQQRDLLEIARQYEILADRIERANGHRDNAG